MTPEIVRRASGWPERTAIVDANGTRSYAALLEASAGLARLLVDGRADLEEARVAFMIPPGFDHVAWQWAIWRAGGVAVPLCLTHPAPELAYVLDDARPEVVVTSPAYEGLLAPLVAERGLRFLRTDAAATPVDGGVLPAVDPDRRAMMIYTSGTTGRPKGVVSTHRVIAAQIQSLVTAWEWMPNDRILLVLPLHHIHGIVNVVGCALWSGATCEMLPAFDVDEAWKRLRTSPLTLFMAVPTIYHRLISAWEEASAEDRRAMSAACRRLRLMVSGSAALPVSTLEAWQRISGHILLERYGMSEIGMGLSNPLHGERVPGHVGGPLPGVEVRLVDDAGASVPDGTPGEIQVRGETVFREYWERPAETAEAFVDGWFRTGDVAVRTEHGYRILGRNSVDILKTGGEKVSALEVEEVLLRHPAVREAAVVGMPDPAWGERIVAAVVPAPGVELDGASVRDWCRRELAPFKVPKEVRFVEALPRNALGKVMKPDLTRALGAITEL